MAIREAALQIYSEFGKEAVTQTLVAQRSGCDRHTVRRHFPNLDDALYLTSTEGQLEALVSAIDARPAHETAVRMVTAAFQDVMRRWAYDETDVMVLRDKAEFLNATPEGPAVVMADFRRNWVEPVANALSDRHGRPGPDRSDRMATELVFILCPRVLNEWRAVGYQEPIDKIADELVAYINGP